MDNLTLFIVGIIFSLVLIPIFQVITDLLFSLCEVVKSKMNVIITKANVEMQKLNSEIEPVETNMIGFEVPQDTEIYYDDEDDFEDKHINNNSRVGF